MKKAGVKRIYAVTGDSLNEVNEAVRKSGKIKWIHVRHEETGAFAAAAEAQLNGELACCAGSSGPGHVHLINGLYDAQRSGAPVLAIASTLPTHEFGTEYFQETNTIKLFEDCSYYNQVATTPEQFPRMLQGSHTGRPFFSRSRSDRSARRPDFEDCNVGRIIPAAFPDQTARLPLGRRDRHIGRPAEQSGKK